MPALVVQLGALQNWSLETVKTAGLVACREPVSSLVQGRQSKKYKLVCLQLELIWASLVVAGMQWRTAERWKFADCNFTALPSPPCS